MAQQSLLARLGMRLSTIGTASYLGFAFPIADLDPSMSAHTGADRIGMYAGRTTGAEKMASVVMGVEQFAVGTDSVILRQQAGAPATPANGMVWITSAGMFCRAGGVTSGPFGAGISGTIAVNQVAYGSGANAIQGSADFVFSAGKLSVGAPADLPTPVSLIRTGANDSDAVGAFRGYNAENTVEFKVNLGGTISGTEPLWQNAMVIEGNRNQGIFPLLNPSNVILSAFNGSINFATASSRLVRLAVTNDGGLDFTGLATGAAPALSPANHGLIYYDSTAQNFYASMNGGAYAAFGGTGTIAGSIAANQVAYGSGANAIQGSAGFTFTTGLLALTSSSVVTQLSLQQTNASTNVQLNMDAGNLGSAVIQYKAASVNTWQQFSNASTMGWFDSAGAWTALALKQGTTATGFLSYAGTKAASSTIAGAVVIGDGSTVATNVAIGGGAIALGQQIDWTGLATVSAPALSAANHGSIYYDSTAQAFYASVNGGAYAAFGSGGITGTLVSGRVPFANGTSSVTTAAAFTFSTAAGISVNRSGATNCQFFGLAGNATQSGVNNNGFGSGALAALTSGPRNNAFGVGAGAAISGGADNVAIGDGALALLTNTGDNIAIGTGALARSVGNSNVGIGTSAGNNITAGSFSVSIGTEANQGSNNGLSVSIGWRSNFNNQVDGGCAVGYQAGRSQTTGTKNSYFGYQAGAAVTAGSNDNTAIGYEALTAINTTGNTAVGAAAADGATSSARITAIGANALGAGTTGISDCTSVGFSALAACTSADHVAVGSGAADALTSPSAGVVAIGKDALGGATTGGGASVAVGYQALLVNGLGANNTAVGYQAGVSITSGSNNVMLGALANPSATVSNCVLIGNGTSSSSSFSIALGVDAACTSANSMVIGSSTSAITAIFVGKGVQNGTPTSVTFNVTSGLGANIAGASLTFAAGRGTGTGVGGAINFQTAKATTSSSTLNTLVTRQSVLQDGAFDYTGIATVDAPDLSAAGHATLYFDSTLNKLMLSENGGAYVPII